MCAGEQCGTRLCYLKRQRTQKNMQRNFTLIDFVNSQYLGYSFDDRRHLAATSVAFDLIAISRSEVIGLDWRLFGVEGGMLGLRKIKRCYTIDENRYCLKTRLRKQYAGHAQAHGRSCFCWNKII